MSKTIEALNPSDSSPELDANPTADRVEDQPDATEDSSTYDAKAGSDSSPDQGAKPKNLSDALDAAADKILAEDSPTEEAETGDEAEQSSEVEPEDGKAKSKDDDVPFNKHPRWQEMLREKKELTTKVQELETRAGLVSELEQYTGGQEGLQNLRALARTFDQSPADAVPMLEKLLEDARARGGLVISDDDLKADLDAGLVSEERAKELQQARIERQNREQAEKQRGEQGQAQAKQAIVTALDAWQQNIQSKNPDFGKLQPRVQREFQALCAVNHPANPQEAVQLAQKAYDDVLSWVQQQLPKPRANNPVRSLNGAGKPTRKPTSVDDAMDAALRAEGLIS